VSGRHSLYWRLALLVMAFCLLIIWLSWSWGGRIEFRGYLLSSAAQQQLRDYAAQAEQAWRTGGAEGVAQWQQHMQERESVWLTVVGRDLRALGTQALSLQDSERLTAMRHLDWPMSKRSRGLPVIAVPFPLEPLSGQLAMQLPVRFMPEGFTWHAQLLVHGLLPCALALLLCAVLYRLLITPLQHLREQANALRDEKLSVHGQPNQRAPRRVGRTGPRFRSHGGTFAGHAERATPIVVRSVPRVAHAP
jgi:two-component system sensor histidine kinase PfeS